jgi:hypothetical protein
MNHENRLRKLEASRLAHGEQLPERGDPLERLQAVFERMKTAWAARFGEDGSAVAELYLQTIARFRVKLRTERVAPVVDLALSAVATLAEAAERIDPDRLVIFPLPDTIFLDKAGLPPDFRYWLGLEQPPPGYRCGLGREQPETVPDTESFPGPEVLTTGQALFMEDGP